MRPLIACIMLGNLGWMGARARESQNGSEQAFLLEDSRTQQWCRFSNEANWKVQVQSRSATTVASAEYAKTSLSRIHVTEESKSGDWTVYDDYFLNGGTLTRLIRRMNILPGDISVEQVFRFTNGRAVLQKTESHDLKTGKPRKTNDNDLPEVPIVTDIHKFPFFLLITDRPGSPHSNEACIPESH